MPRLPGVTRGAAIPLIAALVVIGVVVVFFLLGSGGETLCQVASIGPSCLLEISAGENQPWKAVSVGAFIPTGWSVRLTGKEKGKAETHGVLRLADGGEILIAPDGIIRLSEVVGSRSALTRLMLKLEKGLAGFKFKHDPGRPIQVETPHAVTSVLGTTFFLSVTDDKTSLVVQEGKVGFAPRSGGQTTEVATGQTMTTGSAAPLNMPEFFRRENLWQHPEVLPQAMQ